ncbi:MAG: helix-turn-helix transcriptional regulator, partial [Proteobacteria bacterium]|nr:helix-turn-helix transcriptional regulator [Pseudomonadota bacterium]
INEKKKALTNREHEVLQWVTEGKTNWEISIIIKTSERTVKSHMTNLMRKLNATSRSHAVAIALSHSKEMLKIPD